MASPRLVDNTLKEVVRLREEVRQLRSVLRRLTPGLETLLQRRGFHIYKKEPVQDLLIPAKEFEEHYYRMLGKYSFRLFLRDVIKHQDFFTVDQVTRYATPKVTRSYITYASGAGLLEPVPSGYRLAKRPIMSFGTTLEWYLAEVFKREFSAEAVWGVKFKRPRVGGDYDVIAKIDGNLLYVEVKSSPPKQIYDSEIAAFLDRIRDLSPEISIFFMDTELRMKDKIVPMFEKAFAARLTEAPPIVRIERELFGIENRIFIVNAKEDIVGNISRILYSYYRKESA